MIKKTTVIVGIILLAFCATYAYAQGVDYPHAGDKLFRGISNGLTFWLELPKQIYLTTKDDNVLSGFTYGVIKGVCYGVMRLASGIYDTVTMPIPPYEKVLFDPEFVFEGWEE